jgi:hypothetical protein
MIDDERRRTDEWDRRIEERNQRLDDLYEYRDTSATPDPKPDTAPAPPAPNQEDAP